MACGCWRGKPTTIRQIALFERWHVLYLLQNVLLNHVTYYRVPYVNLSNTVHILLPELRINIREVCKRLYADD
jgi:hypothetical protein